MLSFLNKIFHKQYLRLLYHIKPIVFLIWNVFSMGTSINFLKYPNDFLLYDFNNLKFHINIKVAVCFDSST